MTKKYRSPATKQRTLEAAVLDLLELSAGTATTIAATRCASRR